MDTNYGANFLYNTRLILFAESAGRPSEKDASQLFQQCSKMWNPARGDEHDEAVTCADTVAMLRTYL